jgi:nicotinamide riboside kinase
MSTAKFLCLLGAESTGKTTLAAALSRELASPWVPEYLRSFCDAHGRTPRIEEQALILETQRAHESSAATSHPNARYTICDTAPLLTAIYSDYVFGDRSLYARALECHRRYALTLLLEPDLPWVADGFQRDGDAVREPTTQRIREHLLRGGYPFVSIRGIGDERMRAALHAIDLAVSSA